LDAGIIPILSVVIPVLSVVIPAGVAFITTYLTLRFSKRHSQEQDYNKSMEELQKLYIDAEMHIDEEFEDWWINIEYGNEKGPPPRKYVYPIAKMRMLAQRNEPGLSRDIEQIERVVQILRGNNDPEAWVPAKEYYYREIKGIKFSTIRDRFAKKFEVINQEYFQERGGKSLLTAKFDTDKTTV
jgi:hypothetical protein